MPLKVAFCHHVPVLLLGHTKFLPRLLTILFQLSVWIITSTSRLFRLRLFHHHEILLWSNSHLVGNFSDLVVFFHADSHVPCGLLNRPHLRVPSLVETVAARVSFHSTQLRV